MYVFCILAIFYNEKFFKVIPVSVGGEEYFVHLGGSGAIKGGEQSGK